MSRIRHAHAATATTSSELYPLVQDLTQAEYRTGLCCGGMLGNFSLEELALPSINARTLKSCDSSTSDCSNQGKRHRRAQSLLQLSSALARNTLLTVNPKHRATLSSRTLASCPTEDTGHTQFSDDDIRIVLDQEPKVNTFHDVFVLTRQIYRCNISTIWECVHREHGTRHCVKVMDKRRFTCRADKESSLREISMLTSLQTYQSTYLPRLVQITEDHNQYYLVMDYVEGGNLGALRQAKHHLPEDHVRAITRSLLLGIDEIHRLSVAHLNLSPDNILLEPNFCDVVLCDFGYAWDLRHFNLSLLASRWGVVSPMSLKTGLGNTSAVGTTPRCGNLQYSAPEVIGIEKEFSLAVDMWSVGVILYQLLCGRLPFEDVSKRSLKEKIASGKFKFSGQEWHEVSRGAKQFISALLHPDPGVRMTVGEALTHPWMTQPLENDNWLLHASQKSPSSDKNGKERCNSLVYRLMGKLRSCSSLEVSTSPPPSPPTPLKSNTQALLLDLSKSSTFSSCTVTQESPHPSSTSTKSLILQPSLPRPLDDYRRSRLAEF